MLKSDELLKEFGVVDDPNHDHSFHYLILVLGLAVAGFFFVFFKYNILGQVVVSGLGSLYYSIWGVVHHTLEGRLTRLIALEYVLIGTFVFLLLFATLRLQA
ncbi:hypothetical protein HYW61_01415 [candidate division WWE3 bacterium]|nr:hypothetical protein [candidate division WWE3 bacterium]